MKHWHVKIADGIREKGALTTTLAAAEEEAAIERAGGHPVTGIEACSRDCFKVAPQEPRAGSR